jgi:hypothetical protein
MDREEFPLNVRRVPANTRHRIRDPVPQSGTLPLDLAVVEVR